MPETARHIEMDPHVEASYVAARASRELAITLQPLDVATADMKALRAFRERRPELYAARSGAAGKTTAG